MTMSMRWVKRGAIVLAVLLAAGFAVGSLAGDADRDGLLMQDGFSDLSGFSDASNKAVGFDAPPREIDAVGATAEEFALTQAGDVVSQTEEGSTFGDHVIKTTALSMQVPEGEFDSAWTAAVRIATEAGGEVIGSSRGSGDIYPIYERGADPAPFGTITMRVPATSLDEVTSRLRSSLGEVVSENTSSQDVSQEYVDLKSRLRNMRAEEAALLDLYARARNVRDTLIVRERLSSVRGEIEQVTGRIRYIEDRTEYSTITLNLAEPGAAIGSLRTQGPSFSQAWETAVEGLVRIGTTAMIASIWLAPFALLALAAMALRRRTQPPAPQV